ncbi:hypothetical protein ABGF48_03260 [Helcococcus bovis]|uniref:hypothetical protein n=1 Tax=Helcococcus bovis TaxID=3153252 RepID=UPI0038B8630B
MSLDELDLFLEKRKLDKIERLQELDLLSILINDRISISFSGKKIQYRGVMEYYPELFNNLDEEVEKERINNELRLHQAQMLAFAQRHNSKRKKKGGVKDE